MHCSFSVTKVRTETASEGGIMKCKIISIFIVILTTHGILTAQTVKPAQVSSGDVFTAGQNIEIKSEGVKGDAAIAGANVKISGVITGYLMAAGSDVSIDAPIGNDLYAAGSNVVINNSVTDNVMLAGNSIVTEWGQAFRKTPLPFAANTASMLFRAVVR